eukprot:1158815-Pelagomonas_calceolata.AAC.10
MPSSVSDSDNSGNGDNCESSGVPTDGDTATSSNEESSSSAGEGDDPFQQQVAARFQLFAAVFVVTKNSPKTLTHAQGMGALRLYLQDQQPGLITSALCLSCIPGSDMRDRHHAKKLCCAGTAAEVCEALQS